MPPHPLSAAVVRALDGLVDDGGVPWQGALPDADEVDDAQVVRGRASYATSLPLRLTHRTPLPAHELAALLAGRVGAEPGVGAARATGPGYVEVEPDPVELLNLAVAPNVGAARGDHGALDPLPTPHLGQELCHAVAEVGADAIRFALARRTADRADLAGLDLEVLGRADERNPAHAVQLAHARLAGVLRQGAALGIEPADATEVDADLLSETAARALVVNVAEAGPVGSRALRLQRADLVARHLSATAEAAHDFLSARGVLPTGDEAADRRHRARLRLSLAARDALAHGLDLLGVSAPERM